MAVRLVIAITDRRWFDLLSERPHLQEVNFWAPSGRAFKALTPGELFLFKLHAPDNFIVGGGVFAHDSSMPCSLAWTAFGEANGALSLEEMRARIAKYRKLDPSDRSDFVVGCRVLTQPFFWPRERWLPVPASWSPSIQQSKRYSTDDNEGRELWEAAQSLVAAAGQSVFEEPSMFGDPVLIRPRLGQGAFRMLVTDLYSRRCAITRERTLPALDAAHIKPVGQGGVHEPTNGLLLRRDIHSLFDAGYVTISPDYRFEVSRRIKEEFENGRDYYALHGREAIVPARETERPSRDALTWHNSSVFRG